MRKGDQRLRRGWDGSLGGSMDMFVCILIYNYGGMSSTT